MTSRKPNSAVQCSASCESDPMQPQTPPGRSANRSIGQSGSEVTSKAEADLHVAYSQHKVGWLKTLETLSPRASSPLISQATVVAEESKVAEHFTRSRLLLLMRVSDLYSRGPCTNGINCFSNLLHRKWLHCASTLVSSSLFSFSSILI